MTHDPTPDRPHNRYVLQIEGGHPGQHFFISSDTGLRDLAGRLDRLAEAPFGARFDVQVTERGNPGRRASLAFAKCTDERLLELQQRDLRVQLVAVARTVVLVAVAVLAIVGARTLLLAAFA